MFFEVQYGAFNHSVSMTFNVFTENLMKIEEWVFAI